MYGKFFEQKKEEKDTAHANSSHHPVDNSSPDIVMKPKCARKLVYPHYLSSPSVKLESIDDVKHSVQYLVNLDKFERLTLGKRHD